MILVTIGFVIIALTVWDIKRGDADSIFIFEPLWFLDFERNRFPLIFWAIIIAQFILGLYCIIVGLFS